MRQFTFAVVLFASLGMVASSAEANRGRTASKSSRVKKVVKAKRAKSSAREKKSATSSRGKGSRLGSRLKERARVKEASNKAVKNQALARAIARAFKTYEKNVSGLTRDPRYREPHQQAIAKAVNSLLRNATKTVTASERTKLANAISELRSFRAKNGSYIRGYGDPVVVSRMHQELGVRLKAVFKAAKMKDPSAVDVSPN